MSTSLTTIDGVAGKLALRELAGDQTSPHTLLIAHANGCLLYTSPSPRD